MIDVADSLKSVRTVLVSEFTEMKRERTPILMVLLFCLSIPILYVLLCATGSLNNFISDDASSSMFIGFILSAFPLIVSVIVSIFFAGRVSSEFDSGTILFNITAPISRTEYLFGKFLAYLTTSFTIVLFGYATAGIICFFRSGAFPISDFIIALIIALTVTFSLGATSYLIGLFVKKSSALISLLTIYIICPLILYLVGFVSTTSTRSIGEPGSLNFLGYLPFNSNLMAVREIIDYGQLLALIPLVSSGVPIYTELSPMWCIIVALLWGIAMLSLSVIVIRRKPI